MKNKRDRLFFTQLFVPQASQSSYDRRTELEVLFAIPSAQSACEMENRMKTDKEKTKWSWKRYRNVFFVRALETEDVDIIYDLCSKNKLFYEFHQPFVTRESILDDRNALPPGKSKEDKAYIGLFDGDTLVAVMDLILGYPTEEIVWIGFFMMDTAYQNQGIGTQIIQEAVEAMKNAGYREIRLGVDYGESAKLRVLEQKINLR